MIEETDQTVLGQLVGLKPTLIALPHALKCKISFQISVKDMYNTYVEGKQSKT